MTSPLRIPTIGTLFLTLFALAFFAPLHAALVTLHVDILTDDPALYACTVAAADCSLRGAIAHANAHPQQQFVIELSAGQQYSITVAGAEEDGNTSGDLDILVNLVLTVNNPNGTIPQVENVPKAIINGNQIDRILHIHSGITVTLGSLLITNGLAPHGLVTTTDALTDGKDGGGIYNEGNLTVVNSTISHNSAGNGANGNPFFFVIDAYTRTQSGNGGNGGGIFSTGKLRLETSEVVENRAGTAGSDTLPKAFSSSGGNGGAGGGIYSSGDIALVKSSLRQNFAGDGGIGDGIFELPCRGHGGDGGGIFNTGQLHIAESEIVENQAGEAGSGGNLVPLDCTRAGYGGAIANEGRAWLHKSLVTRNQSGDGNSPSWTWVHDYISPGGDGGGIFNQGWLSATQIILLANRTGVGGDSGNGAGLMNRGNAFIEQSTLVQNRTGVPTGSAPFESGSGGALYNEGDLTIANTIFTENRTGDGNQGWLIEPGVGANGGNSGNGGAIANVGKLTTLNSLFVANATGNGGDGYQESAPASTVGGNSGNGGAIFAIGESYLLNTTIVNNVIGQAGKGYSTKFEPFLLGHPGRGAAISGSVQITLINSILWNNLSVTGFVTDSVAGAINISYSLVEGGIAGSHNLGGHPGEQPNFLSTNDFRLAPGSAAIDSGNDNALLLDAADWDQDGVSNEPIPHDLAGAPRIQQSHVDMGAYEFDPSTFDTIYLPIISQ